MISAAEPIMPLEVRLTLEQSNLVRFCTHLTRDAQAAEDLAQETLLIAWRRRATLTDPTGLTQWLKAIARNVCRHWQRSQTRQRQHLPLLDQDETDETSTNENLVGDFDLEVELDRSELVTLLDRALGLLPPETRSLLMQHYVEELPLGELAQQAGVSTGAVAVRLHRGKVALRQTLVTDFREDAVAYGLVTPSATGWTETRIWCFICGQHRLQGRFDHAQNTLCLRCPHCCDTTDANHTLADLRMKELQGIKAYKPAFSRALGCIHDYYFAQNIAGTVPCQLCGKRFPIRSGLAPWLPGSTDDIYACCDQCNKPFSADSWLPLALTLPQVRHFWRAYPRMAGLPIRHVEIGNDPAVLTGFASVSNGAKIEVAFSRNTFELIYLA